MRNILCFYIFICLWLQGFAYSFNTPASSATSSKVTAPNEKGKLKKEYYLLDNYYAEVYKVDKFIANQEYEELFSFYRNITAQLVAETDPCELFVDYSLIAQLQHKQRLFRPYITSLHSAYGFLSACNPMKPRTRMYMRIGMLNNIIQAYNILEEPSNALKVSEYASSLFEQWSSLDISENNNKIRSVSRGIFYQNVAQSHYQLRNLSEAEMLWKDATEILSKWEGVHQKALVSVNIGLSALYLDQNNPEKAFTALNEARNHYLNFTDESLYMQLADGFRNYYESQKDYENAFEYFKLANETVQSIDEQAEKLRTFNADFEIEYLEKELENYAITQQVNRLRLLVFTSFIFLVILGLILWAFWYRKNLLEKSYNKLRLSTKVILSQNTQLNESIYFTKNHLSHISHDFQNLFSGLKFASRQISTSGGVSEKVKNYARIIDDSITNMSKLIVNSLKSPFPENSDKNLQVLDIDILLSKIKVITEPLLSEKNQVLIIQHNKNLTIKIDETKMTRILINLIENASKFSPKNSRIWVTARSAENQSIVFTVEDEGPGISEKVYEHLFEARVSESNQFSKNYPSSGLGLYLAKLFTLEMGGTIVLLKTEDPKKGARFEVTLPCLETGELNN